MALTLNQFWGGETGGLEEFSATFGSPDPTEAVIVRSGARALSMDGASTQSANLALFDEVADAGTGHAFGFGVYLGTGVTPSSAVVIGNILNDAAGVVGQIELQTDGTLHLLDSLGAIAVNGTITLKANIHHFIEVYFVASGTGASELIIDNASAGTGTSDDFLNGTLDEFQFAATSALDGVIVFDDWYWLSGATAASDRYGPGVSVYGYGPGRNSAVSDWSNSGLPDAGGDLNIGTWLAPSEVPWDDTNVNAEYTTSSAIEGVIGCDDSAGGAGLGPSGGNKIVSGVIKGAKWGWRGDRSGGGSTTQEIVFGSAPGSSLSAQLDAETITVLSGTATHHFALLPASSNRVPILTDIFAIGIANDGGRDWELIAYECFLLHVSETVVTDLDDGLMPEYPSHGLTVEV